MTNELIWYSKELKSRCSILWASHSLVSSPSTLQHCKRKGGSGEYSTTFLYFRGISAVQIDLAIIPPVLGFLTHHTFTDLLSTLSNLLKPSKTLQRLSF